MLYTLLLVYYVAGGVNIERIEHLTQQQCYEKSDFWMENYPVGNYEAVAPYHKASCIPEITKENN
jgi:hypothetical protein